MWVLELSLSQDWWQWEVLPIMLPSFVKSKLGNINIREERGSQKQKRET
jgi:hypothetical protein